MSRHTRKTDIIKCDIPGCDETDEYSQSRPFRTEEIDGRAWDICKTCYRKGRPIIAFLASVVGIDIPITGRSQDLSDIEVAGLWQR